MKKLIFILSLCIFVSCKTKEEREIDIQLEQIENYIDSASHGYSLPAILTKADSANIDWGEDTYHNCLD